MKRRTFITSVSASAGVLIPGKAISLGDNGQKTDTVVIISDIGAETSLSGLKIVLDALIAQNVPCLCVIDPAISSASPLMPDDPRAFLLRQLWADYPGLIELAPFIANLASQKPYFQARLASIGLIQLAETLDLTGLIRTGRKIDTICCFGSEEAVSFDGLRSTGARTVMAIPQKGALSLRNRISPSNVLTVVGGRRVSFFDPAERLLNPQKRESHNILVFSAKDFALRDNPALAAAAARFAQATVEQDLRGKGTLTQGRDILVRDGNSFRRKVAVHVFDASPGDGEAGKAVTEFDAMLKEKGLSRSASAMPDGGGGGASLGFWIPDIGQPTPVQLPHPPSVATKSPGTTLILGRTNRSWRGLDDLGNLHFPLSFEVHSPLREGQLVSALGPLDDATILIHPSGVATHAQRRSVTRALTALQEDGFTDVTSLTDLVATIMPPDLLIPVFRRTEAASPAFLRRGRSDRVADEDRDLLTKDARLAWAYFDKFTNPRTGLCAAAASVSARDAILYDRLTMWDIGSHINALVAAADLKLIEITEFKTRIKNVLRHLTGRKILGYLLPPEEVIVGTGRTTRHFNASDTGRLLSSLAQLARHPFAEKAKVQALVASWDLKNVIVNGGYHSIKNQLLVPADSSQYADYSAKGLAAWGIEAKTPYAGFSDRSSADQKMAFLDTLARLGPFGSEPVLLQALDHGLDTASGYVIDTLFASMLEDFEQNGRLLCPSETPLDGPPWFIYQGLQVDSKAHPWRVLVDQDGETVGESADASQMAISCKAAYLWAAVVPHPHSTRLLRFVREKSTGSVGFSSCIYLDSGKATAGVTDINTNGIILQSIAAILSKPQPGVVLLP